MLITFVSGVPNTCTGCTHLQFCHLSGSQQSGWGTGLPHTRKAGEDKYDPSQRRKCSTAPQASIRTNMLKFSLTLPIILSALYILLSQAELKLPTCALSCANTAGSQSGCNMCAFSIRIMLPPCLTRPPIAELIRNVSVTAPCSSQFWKVVCSWNVTATS
jgi:hypothetical protein